MKSKDIKEALKDVKDDEEVLLYLGQGHFVPLVFLNRRPVSLVKSRESGNYGWFASDNFETSFGEVTRTEELPFFVANMTGRVVV